MDLEYCGDAIACSMAVMYERRLYERLKTLIGRVHFCSRNVADAASAGSNLPRASKMRLHVGYLKTRNRHHSYTKGRSFRVPVPGEELTNRRSSSQPVVVSAQLLAIFAKGKAFIRSSTAATIVQQYLVIR